MFNYFHTAITVKYVGLTDTKLGGWFTVNLRFASKWGKRENGCGYLFSSELHKLGNIGVAWHVLLDI